MTTEARLGQVANYVDERTGAAAWMKKNLCGTGYIKCGLVTWAQQMLSGLLIERYCTTHMGTDL